MEVECQGNCNDDDGDDKLQKVTGQRRSPRITGTPHRYGEWVYIIHNLSDPLTIEEVLSSTEKKQ